MIVKIKFTDDVVSVLEVESVEYKPEGTDIRVKGYTCRAKTVSVYIDGHLIDHIDVEDLS